MATPADTGIRRLQVGTSKLENLPPRIRDTFAGPAWVSLGEPPPTFEPPPPPAGLRARVRRALGAGHGDPSYDRDLYRGTAFLAWYFRPGLHLPFRDGQFDFAFSEHFLEHLFMDEAFELLLDLRRVLRPGGVLRTSVPDADLRTYEPPEPVGFGAAEGRKGLALEWTHPAKHKTRWSIHNLPLILRQAGFEPVPLVWCDAAGALHERAPGALTDAYAGCADAEMIGRLDYLLRPRSLVVDGVRR
jgi:predicted SAM-dependent methyltransferase